jgi:hypothetical protein
VAGGGGVQTLLRQLILERHRGALLALDRSTHRALSDSRFGGGEFFDLQFVNLRRSPARCDSQVGAVVDGWADGGG